MSRSVPFLILMILLIPFTRVIVGTSIGTTATIVQVFQSVGTLLAVKSDKRIKK